MHTTQFSYQTFPHHLTLFWFSLFHVLKNAPGTKCKPAIWQSYINSILTMYLTDQSFYQLWMIYCCIVQDMVIWNMWKIFWKHSLRAVWKYPQRTVNSLELNYYIWITLLLSKTKAVCTKSLKTRLQAIQNLKPLKTAKDNKSFQQ